MFAASAQNFIATQALGFRYPGRTTPALSGFDLKIAPGEFVVLAGPTGGGKSTLLKVLAGLLPGLSSGERLGAFQATPGLRSGMVFQSPDDQLFAHTLFDEVALGPRQQGLNDAAVAERVSNALATVGLSKLNPQQDPERLSGGQKQRLALAAALAGTQSTSTQTGAALLALDEPLSQLDSQGSHEIVRALAQIHQNWSTQATGAILAAEHRWFDFFPALSASNPPGNWRGADRLILIAQGQPAGNFAAHELQTPAAQAAIQALGLRLPSSWKVTVPEASTPPTARADAPALLTLERVSFRYPNTPKDHWALQQINFSVQPGERIALLGANGSGKSTLLALLAGLYRPQEGQVYLNTPSGYTFQNPDVMLLCPTALDECAFGPRYRLRLERAAALKQGLMALCLLGLEERAAEAPLALSRGQRLRLAVCATLASGASVLLLDEPTTGQDRMHLELLLQALDPRARHDLDPAVKLARPQALVFSTHDLELAQAWADRIVRLEQGRIYSAT